MILIPLEDNFTDVLGKAQRGLDLSGTELSQRAGISLAQLNAVRGGEVDEAVLRKLVRLEAGTGGKGWVRGREALAGAEAFADGKTFAVGGLRIEARRTSGHARGGTSFVVTGLARRVAVVGDALFAGSMGGGMVDYG